jgi:hypothetical protein
MGIGEGEVLRIGAEGVVMAGSRKGTVRGSSTWAEQVGMAGAGGRGVMKGNGGGTGGMRGKEGAQGISGGGQRGAGEKGEMEA